MSGPVAVARDTVRARYGHNVGQPIEQATTPALVLDLPALERNLIRMADAMAKMPTTLRPHAKTHKSPEIARLQVKHGAVGLCTATVWEALILADAGLDDLFVVNAVVGRAQLRAVAELARDHRIAVAADAAEHIALLGAAARAAGSTVGVMVELDTGMRRGGVDSASEAVTVAHGVEAEAGLDLRGITGYEGHCSDEPDVNCRTEMQQVAMTKLRASAQAIRAAGLPCPAVSAGGTRTWWLTAATPDLTEIQAGSYALMDRFHTGVVGGFEPAVSVLATVVHRHGGRVVIDVGNKSIGDAGLAQLAGHDLANLGFDEEHGRFAAPSRGGLRIGEVVRVLPGYTPTTVNTFDAYLVVDESGIVIDIWPIVPRSPEHHGLAHPSNEMS